MATNAQSVAISSFSVGWSAIVNEATRTITVWPVGATEEGMTEADLPTEGTVVVNALNEDNEATSYSIYVYIATTESVDGDGKALANCYVVTKPATSYTFDVMHRPDGTEMETNSVKLLWQSNPNVVKNVNFVDGKVVFYVAPYSDDVLRVEDTNAVIAAYDKGGDIIWSWHLWVVNENPLLAIDEYSNGKTFMRQNLGAFTNSNGSIEAEKIHASYGMYYQWGRKDPFPRPYYYDASGADDESRYNDTGSYITEVYEERTSSNGTVAYVTENPMVFITTAADLDVEDGSFDWLAPDFSDDNLWSDEKKSLYDPCPYGWRVPTAADLSVLAADPNEGADLNETLRKQYGWHLSDGVSTYFWSACGRRRYSDGKVDNMNYKEGVYPSEPQPWEGHYWTSSTTSDGKAVSLYFDLTTTRTINKFNNAYSERRANGFQVRCVKE